MRSDNHRFSLVPAIVLSLLLTACSSGGGGSFNQNSPPPQSGELLFGADLAGVVITEKFDTSSGTLSGATETPGSNGDGIAANPAGTFLYASDPSSNAVDGFAVSSSGTLSAITGSPFAVPGSGVVTGIAVDASGQYLYASSSNHGAGVVAAFSIGSSGALTPIAGSPFAAGTSPVNIAITPGNPFLYVSDSGSGLLGFSISPSTGALTPIAGSPFAGGLQGVAFTPNGKFAYAIDIDTSVWAYSIDSTSGVLTAISGSPFLAVPGSQGFTSQIIVDPLGRYVYTYNTVGTTSISALTINATTGALSQVSGSPYTTNNSDYFAANLAIDPSGSFLYASCSSGSCGVLGFNIDGTTGALTPLSGSPFNSQFNIGSMTIVQLK